jgi:phosphatidylserine/phosphatidylglycerophosphate/cardiolipin synthase-like enzyme
VLEVIRNAQSSLALSLFRCNDEEFFSEIAGAAARGVVVDVLVTARAKGGTKKLHKLFAALRRTGANLSIYSDPVVKYHAKYLVADDGPAVVTSLNFTRKCFSKTLDVLLLTWDPGVVSGLRQLMAADRDRRGLPASLTRRLIVGPERARSRFTELLGSARSSIRIVDSKLSDPDLLALLETKRASGVAVQILRSKRLGNLKSHGKFVLIDDRIATVGSLGLAALALDFRREVAITIEDADGIAEIVRVFDDLTSRPLATSDAPAEYEA